MNILGINPGGSASYIIKRMKEKGVTIIVVSTDAALTDEEKQKYPHRNYWTFPFEKIIDVTGKSDEEALRIIDEAQKQYHFVHGFSGSEGALEASEKLLAHLFPDYSNDPKTTRYRYDKYWMNEVLHEKGIPAIAQVRIGSDLKLEEKIKIAQQFYKEHGEDIIIKPNSGSAGSVDVLKTSDLEKIDMYFNREHQGFFYESDFLVQEVVHGDEYYVDFSSYGGEHRLSAVGKLEKELVEGSFEYLYADNVSLEGDDMLRIIDYAKLCLEALGVTNGFSHVEITDTPNGFRLIELNPRLSGSDGYHNIMAKRRYDEDQIDLYIDLLNGQKSHREISKATLYQRLVYFKNKKGAYTFADDSPVRALKSYVAHEIKRPTMAEGVPEKVTLLTTVMYVLLESDQQEIIDHDFQLLMKYEETDDCLKLTK